MKKKIFFWELDTLRSHIRLAWLFVRQKKSRSSKIIFRLFFAKKYQTDVDEFKFFEGFFKKKIAKPTKIWH